MTDEKFGKCPYYTAQSVLQGKWSILIMLTHRQNSAI